MEADIRDVRIERYFPDVLSSADDFKALAAAVDPELIGVWKALWKQMLNTFVYDLDTDGAARWESMLKLYPASTDSLDARKRAILARINSALPYTFKNFQSLLDSVYGSGNAVESVDYGSRALWIDLSASILNKSAAVRRMATVISPANMTIGISNTKSCELSQYYGMAVARYTHITIAASTGCNLNVSIDADSYPIAAIANYKHIEIGG